MCVRVRAHVHKLTCDSLDRAGEVRTNALATFTNGPLQMDVTVLSDQQRLTSALFGHRVHPRGPNKGDG